jgi:hypothetical protein
MREHLAVLARSGGTPRSSVRSRRRAMEWLDLRWPALDGVLCCGLAVGRPDRKRNMILGHLRRHLLFAFSGAAHGRPLAALPRRLDSRARDCLSRALPGVRSSAGEHCLHTAGVTGSIPVAPTIKSKACAIRRRRRGLPGAIRRSCGDCRGATQRSPHWWRGAADWGPVAGGGPRAALTPTVPRPAFRPLSTAKDRRRQRIGDGKGSAPVRVKTVSGRGRSTSPQRRVIIGTHDHDRLDRGATKSIVPHPVVEERCSRAAMAARSGGHCRQAEGCYPDPNQAQGQLASDAIQNIVRSGLPDIGAMSGLASREPAILPGRPSAAGSTAAEPASTVTFCRTTCSTETAGRPGPRSARAHSANHSVATRFCQARHPHPASRARGAPLQAAIVARSAALSCPVGANPAAPAGHDGTTPA